MTAVPEKVRKAYETLSAFPVATASPDGKPNLIYMTFLRMIDDETLELADNFFHKTRQNLEDNPWVTVTFWGPDTDGSYQVKGKTEIITKGPVFDECVAWVKENHDSLEPKACVRVHVEEIYSGADKLA